MNKRQAQQLITKYKAGLCNEKEIQILNRWIDDQGVDHPDYEFKSNEQENLLKETMRSHIKNRILREKKRKKQSQVTRLLKVAAMLLLVSAIGIWGWNSYNHKQSEQFITVYAPAGQLKTLILPDGSKVSLNAASKISFPSRFTSENRKVTLVGEAYFDVVHDPQKPFLIYTGKVKTQVLGTSFNVKAYANEPKITVAVITGKVGVMAGRLSVLLTPNQKADYSDKDGQLLKETIADASALKVWTNGQLVFRDQPFNEITRTLTRRYNTNIIIQNNRVAGAILNARFDKNESLETVIGVLCTYVGARYNHEGTTYLIR